MINVIAERASNNVYPTGCVYVPSFALIGCNPRLNGHAGCLAPLRLCGNDRINRDLTVERQGEKAVYGTLIASSAIGATMWNLDPIPVTVGRDEQCSPCIKHRQKPRVMGLTILV